MPSGGNCRRPGPWQSAYALFAKWRDDGTLERAFHTLSGDADMENLSMDSICVKVHESANGVEKQRIRRSVVPEVSGAKTPRGRGWFGKPGGVPSLCWK